MTCNQVPRHKAKLLPCPCSIQSCDVSIVACVGRNAFCAQYHGQTDKQWSGPILAAQVPVMSTHHHGQLLLATALAQPLQCSFQRFGLLILHAAEVEGQQQSLTQPLCILIDVSCAQAALLSLLSVSYKVQPRNCRS